MFSEIRKRYSRHTGDVMVPAATAATDGVFVQQFRFLRLAENVNYEPIVVALKGLQISRRPGTFLTAKQYETSRRHRNLFEDLVAWGAAPEPIDPRQIGRFLGHVQDGLDHEKRGKPCHTGAYISWAMSELRDRLGEFNQRLLPPGPTATAEAET